MVDVIVSTAGLQGRRGAGWLSGVGVPVTNMVGSIDGDFYINTSTPALYYGPRTNGLWGTAHSFTSGGGSFPQYNTTATTNPSVNDDQTEGYSAGSLWININTNGLFLAVSVATGAAVWEQTITAGFPAGGDLTGSNYPNPVVHSIQGVVISGTPSANQVLEATSPSAATWTSLPSSLPPTGAAGGDLTGSNYPNPVVHSLQGVVITGTPSANQVLEATSPTAATWVTPAGSSPTGAAGGDLTGSNYPNPVVSRIGGAIIAGSVATGKALVGTDNTDLQWSETDGIGPWIYNVMSHGAKADGKQVHDGVMGSGAFILTSATAVFTANDVNKVIQVKGAGNAQSTTLVTTIASYQSPTQVTLAAANASGSSLTGLAVMWGTDDAASINSAVSAAFTHAQATGGTVKVFFPVPVNPNGFYAIGGALLHTASGNAQIPIPLQLTTANKITIIFEGAGNNSGFQHWQQTAMQTGVTLLSFGVYANSTAQNNDINANGNPSVIGGPTTPNGYGVSPGIFNNVLPVLRNLSIRNSHNANGFAWGAWDFYGCAEANVENVLYGTTGNVVDGDFGNPGTFGSGSAIGMLMPAPGNNDNSRAQNIACQGGYTFAAFLPEHFVVDRISILYCWAGVCPVGTYGGSVGSTHAINLGQASVEACANTLCVIGAGSGGVGPWVYGVLDAEGTITFIDRFVTSGVGLAALLGEVELVGIVNPDTVSLQSPTGLNIINGMQGYNSRTINSNTTTSYTVTVMDQTVYVDTTTASVDITLISAQWTPKTFTFKKIGTGNSLTIHGAGGQLIDGAATFVINTNNGAVTVAPQGGIGTAWNIIATH